MKWLAAAMWLTWCGPALALEPCFSSSTGEWRGPVLSGAKITMMESEFHIAGDALEGSYFVHDPQPYAGTLTGFHRTGPCEAEFAWTDKFGVGVVSIRFEPQLGQFLGLWGEVEPMYEHIFDGFRLRPDLQS